VIVMFGTLALAANMNGVELIKIKRFLDTLEGETVPAVYQLTRAAAFVSSIESEGVVMLVLKRPVGI
jgi:hypothetical protein